MGQGPLTSLLIERFEAIDTWIGGHGGPVVRQVVEGLREPLRVAVVGRVKAGKSTLVNALIGQRVAPTGTTECTRVVTWYRYGLPARAEVVHRDGNRTPLPMTDGLPDTLGVPLDEVRRIEVQLGERPLRSFTLVDTPGLASLTTELGDAARDAIVGDRSSRAAVGDVDAIVFTFRDTERRDDVDLVEAFSAATGMLGAGGMNAIGVLSHADTFGAGAFGDDDPLDTADAYARRSLEAHGELFADVVPVSGLLAETARTGRLTEQHAADLAKLAAVQDARLQLWQMRLQDPTAAATLGLSTELPEARARLLLRLLGPYGVRHARHVAGRGAAALYRWCEEHDGLARLERALTERFSRRADALKAAKAMTAVERLRYDTGIDAAARQRLRDELETLELDPRMHTLREWRAAELLRRRPRPDCSVLEALQRIIDADGPADALGVDDTRGGQQMHQLALERASWATGIAATAAPDLELAEAGRVLARSYVLLADRLS